MQPQKDNFLDTIAQTTGRDTPTAAPTHKYKDRIPFSLTKSQTRTTSCMYHHKTTDRDIQKKYKLGENTMYMEHAARARSQRDTDQQAHIIPSETETEIGVL